MTVICLEYLVNKVECLDDNRFFWNLGVFFEIKRKISENQIILIEFLVIRCYTIYGGV